MPDVVEPDLFVESYLPSFEPIEVVLPIQKTSLLLLGVDDLPEPVFLS